ncbi:MAG TPA: hypothetical protein EYP40_00450 [Chromatiales bacterium]|nr:hypothetical protein [Chromatiales bacterium]
MPGRSAILLIPLLVLLVLLGGCTRFVDPEQLKLHRKILAYAEEHDTDYATAAIAVGGAN